MRNLPVAALTAALVTILFITPLCAQTTYTAVDQTSLTTAISTASPGDIIAIGNDITLTASLPNIPINNLTINGSGYTINANSTAAIFVTNSVASAFTFNNIFLSNGTTSHGGAISAASGLTLGNNITFKNNSASQRGGAIHGNNVNITISGNTSFIGNTSGLGNSGGAIDMGTTGVYTLTLNANTGDIVFSGNTADGKPNSIFLESNKTLQLQGNHNIYFDDPINSEVVSLGSRPGNTLIKSGNGFVQFLGTNTLTRTDATSYAVNIQSGTFRLADDATFKATSTGTFTVADGATLAGQGTITAPSTGFVLAGMISPDHWRYHIGGSRTGTDIGTLTLVGAVALQNTSTLVVDLSASSCDCLNVTGAVTIDSGAKLDIVGTAAAGTTWTFLSTSGGITGDFDTDPSWSGIFDVTKSGNDYIITVLAPPTPPPPPPPVSLQGAVVFAANQEGMMRMQRQYHRHFQDRHWEYWRDWSNGGDGVILGAAPCDPVQSRGRSLRSPRMWASFTADWQGRNDIGASDGYDLRSAGVIVGADRKLTQNLFLGGAFGYDNAYQELRSDSAADRIDAFRSTLYAGGRSGDIFTDAYLGYTKDWHRTQRETAGGVAQSKYDDDLFSTGIEIRRKLSFGSLRFVPSLGLHYAYLASPSVTESGVGGLMIARSSYESLRTPIGAKLTHTLKSRGRSSTLRSPRMDAELRAFYVREFCDDTARVRGTSFALDGGSWGRNSGRFGAGLNVQLTDRLNMQVDYDYEVYDHTSADVFAASLGVRW